MRSDFQTEAIDEQLTVLFICDNQEIATYFAHLWKSKKITVELITRLRAGKELIDQSKKWYKIFWWEDGEKELENKEITLIQQAIKDRRELSYILMPAPFVTHVTTWQGSAKYFQHLYQRIEQRTPYTSIFCQTDVVSTISFSLLREKINYLVANKQVEEQLVFHPLSLEDYLQQVVEQSLVPRGGQRKLFVGKHTIAFSTILQHLCKEKKLAVTTFEELSLPLSKLVGEWRKVVVEGPEPLERIAEILQLSSGKEKVTQPPLSPTAHSIPKPQLQSKVKKVKKERVEEIATIVRPPVVVKTTKSQPPESVSPPIKKVIIPVNTPPEIKRSKLILESFSFAKNSSSHHSHPKLNEMEKKQPKAVVRPVELERRKAASSTAKHQEIERKISDLFATVTHAQGHTHPPKAMAKNKVFKRTNFTISRRWIPAVTVASMPFILSVFYVGNAWLVQRLSDSVARQMTLNQAVSAPQAKRLESLSRFLAVQTQAYGFVLPESVEEKHRFLALWSARLGMIARQSSALQQDLHQVVGQTLGKQDGDPFQTLESLTGKVDELYRMTGDLEAELKNQHDPETDLSQEKQAIQDHLRQTKKQLLVVQQLLGQADRLLARGTTKTYAVLLQDNQEIRPSGGFIQSIALVTMNNGKIGDIQYHRADSLDKELQGVMVAPSDLATQLKEQHLYLHDANWFGDFTESGEKIAWFIEKSTGRDVQGVIALNTTVLQELLKITGDVSVQNEVVSSQNVQDKILVHARESLETTTGVTDFFTNVYATVFSALLDAEPSTYSTAFHVFRKLFDQAEIQITSSDPALQTTFKTLAWTGEIVTPPCPAQFSSTECRVATLYQLDTNVGINKANKFIKKKHEQNIELKEDQTIYNYKLTYENSGKSDVWPGGPVPNYVRIYLGNLSVLQKIEVNGVVIETSNIKIEKYNDYQMIGFNIEIPTQSITTVSMTYTEPPISAGEAFTFFWQRQAGVGNTPLTLSLKAHNSLIPTLVAPEASLSSDQIVFRFAGNQHAFAGVKFK